MLHVGFKGYNDYITDSLYQWDLNQTLEITGLNLSTVPQILFANKFSVAAEPITAQASGDTISCEIPNLLLTQPYPIFAYIRITEGNLVHTVEKLKIPVIETVKPENYEYEENIAVLTYDDLKVLIANKANYSDFKSLSAIVDQLVNDGVSPETVQNSVKAWIDQAIEDGTIAAMTIEDGSITKEKLAEDIDLGVKDGSITFPKLASDIVNEKSAMGYTTTLLNDYKDNFETDFLTVNDPNYPLLRLHNFTESTNYATIELTWYDAGQSRLSIYWLSVLSGCIYDRAPENAVLFKIKGNKEGLGLVYEKANTDKQLVIAGKHDSEYGAIEKTYEYTGSGTTGDTTYSDFLPVIPGETYKYSCSNSDAPPVYYAADKTYKIGTAVTTALDDDGYKSFTVPDMVSYVQIYRWNGQNFNVTGKFLDKYYTIPDLNLSPENFNDEIYDTLREKLGLNIGKTDANVYYDCTHYGVVSTSDDNTAAMQALIDLVHENGGGVIWIPIGTYIFNSAQSATDMTNNITMLLEAKSNVSIIGESISGSILKVTGNTAQGAGLFCQNSVHSGEILTGCTYQNFTVDMSEASLTTYTHRGKAFYYSGIKDCVFRDLRLISTPSTSLGIDMLDNVVMDSIYVYEGGRQWTDGGNGGAGIGIGTGKWKNENYIIRNCVCDSCGHFGIFLEDQGIFSAAKDRNYPKGQIIANNVIRNGRNYALGVRGGKNVLVISNNVYENKGGIYTDYGAENIVFSGNLIQGCTEAGFNYGDEMSKVNNANYPCKNIVVTGNTFFDNAVGIKKTHTPENCQEVNNIFLNNTADTE